MWVATHSSVLSWFAQMLWTRLIILYGEGKKNLYLDLVSSGKVGYIFYWGLIETLLKLVAILKNTLTFVEFYKI